MKKLLLLMLVLLSSCNKNVNNNKVESSLESSLENSLVYILHAGGGIDDLRYLNAQETFKYYYDLGYRYFEYDLKLSTDNRLIGTHAFEHLDVDTTMFTYEEFKELRLENGYTPVNEEWLIEALINYSDVTFVIDAKMDSDEMDAKVLERIEELEGIYNVDLSKNILPEVFSLEMWNIVKETTSFERYFFSQYKVYYSIEFVLENFNDDRIYGVAYSSTCDNYIRRNIYRLKEAGKKLFFFTPSSYEEIIDMISLGADGVYIDNDKVRMG